MLNPTFHSEILDNFLDVMNRQSETLIEKLTRMVKEGEEIDMFEMIQFCALDVVSGN